MERSVVEWLGAIGSAALVWSFGLFVLINVTAAVVFLIRRDRAQVNRWVGRLLAVDLLLLGTGAGVPLVTTMARFAVTFVSASFGEPAVQVTMPDASLEFEGAGKSGLRRM